MFRLETKTLLLSLLLEDGLSTGQLGGGDGFARTGQRVGVVGRSSGSFYKIEKSLIFGVYEDSQLYFTISSHSS